MKTDNTERIENFIDGIMSPEELLKFQEELKTNKALAAEYEQRLRIASVWQTATKYADTRNEVKNAFGQEKTRIRRRITGFSIAASFLVLVALTTVLYFTVNTIPSDQVAEIKEKPITPQIKIPEETGSGGVIEKIILLHPVNDTLCSRNDSLVFRWSPALADSSCIVIGSEKTQNVVFREKLKPRNSCFKIDEQFLPIGHYYWQIENFPDKQKFRIID